MFISIKNVIIKLGRYSVLPTIPQDN